jgi:hypothetical protein
VKTRVFLYPPPLGVDLKPTRQPAIRIASKPVVIGDFDGITFGSKVPLIVADRKVWATVHSIDPIAAPGELLSAFASEEI